MRQQVFQAILCGIISTQAWAQQQPDTIAVKYARTITGADLSKHLHIIASDEYEGRETAQKGQWLAADYLAKHFRECGLLPAGEDYFQKYPLVLEYADDISLSINGNKYRNAQDFYSYRGHADTAITASEMAFIGHGADEERYSDWRGMNIEGKVVLLLSGNGSEQGTRQGWRQVAGKISDLKEAGAAAIFMVDDNFSKNTRRLKHRLSKPSMRLDVGDTSPKDIPFYFISEKTAKALLAQSGKKIKKLKKQMAATNQPRGIAREGEIQRGQPSPFIAKAAIQLNARPRKEKTSSENVLAYLEGTDKKDELLIITAHYDHLGVHDGKVYNGADDDGSGTVAVLEIAEAFALAAREGHRPRRSILFMPVSGEEKGLLGSSWYVENPAFPLENTMANLNIDMIGRWDEKHKGDTNYVYLIGADRLSKELHQVSEQANATYAGLALDYTFNDPNDPNRFYYRSDHYNFASKNIPVIFYFSGVHKDYHQHSDTVDKIHFPLLEKRARLIFHTAWQLANQEERIALDKQEEIEE